MTRRARTIGWVSALLFTLVNLWGMWMAAAAEELIHMAIHAVLLLPGAYFVWRLTPGRAGGRLSSTGSEERSRV